MGGTEFTTPPIRCHERLGIPLHGRAGLRLHLLLGEGNEPMSRPRNRSWWNPLSWIVLVFEILGTVLSHVFDVLD